MSWDEVDALRRKWGDDVWRRRIQLLKLKWVLLPLEDGVWCARRLLPTDPEEVDFGGEPEVRAKSWEILLASVEAKNGKRVARG